LSAQEPGNAVAAPSKRVALSETVQQVNIFQLMEQVLEKCKLLNYETEFCRSRNMKPLNKTYFAMPSSNPNEQLYCFTSLIHWLLSSMSRNFSAPSQHDNPNAVAGIILQELRGAGLPCDYPPAKVKQGHGETVLQILDSACDSVLAAQHFSWARPAHKTDEYDDEAEVDESAELDDGIDDAIAIEEEEGLYMDGLTSPGGANSDPNESPSRREIMESSVPAAQWKMELERVAPQLKAIQSVDHKEWRAHLEQTKSLKESMSIGGASDGLNRLATEVHNGLEEVRKSERRMNTNLEHLVDDFRNRSKQTEEDKMQYETVLSKVNDLTNNLASISDELEEVKNKMEDRGSSMTDASPVVNMKKSLSQVKHDSKLMDIRIGVAQHALLQAKLVKQRNAISGPVGLNGLHPSDRDRRDGSEDDMYD